MTTNIAVNRGSEWRKWDLHFHTPSSYDYKDKSVTNQKIIDILAENKISVVAITDHHTMDIDRIKNLQQLGKDKGITVLPGIEFCSELGGSESIHFIGIFSEKSDFSTIWTKIQGKHNLTKADIECKGNERIVCNFVDTCKTIIELGGIISVHAGSKSNSIESIKSNLLVKQETKTTFLSDYISILEVGKPEDEKVYQEKVFPSIGFKLPIIICSDNHDIKNYFLKENCWIKADPTFEGLKQIIYEPEERVRIQQNNPIFDFEKSPFTEIQIDEDAQIFENEEDGVVLAKTILPINSGLVSIIGGRGTGKSILVDYISSGLGKKTEKNYTRNDKVSIKRKTSLKEEDTTFVLSNQPNIQFMYISQSEIKRIVEKPEEFTKNIRETIGVISEYNIPSEYQEKVDMYINELSNIIKVLEENNTNSNQKKEDIDKEIKRYSDFITNVTSQENKTKLEKYQKNLDLLANRKSFYESLQSEKTKIEQFQNQTNEYLQKVNDVLNEKFAINIPLINNTEVIDSISQMVLPKIQELIIQVEEEISNTKNTFANYNGDLTSLLNNVGQYQNKITDLQKQKQNIEDNEKRFISIKENKFKELGRDIENSINSYKQEIENKWENFKNGNDYTEEQRELISDILGGDNLNVSVEIDFDKEKLYQLLMRNLDGRSWNPDKLEKLLFIKDLQSYLSFVKQETEINVFSDTLISIRSYILDIFFRKFKEYISHNIIITSKNKNITKLSHGQRGTIYLQLKLAANIFSETIIYDQPEDDLDNEFIMSDLVSIFKKIKKYRQVIIVSHNANLVVNADSEQVIVAKNEDSTLSYIAGSLENPTINEQICKILEGGKEAFKNREMKYGFN
jgi:ATPase involved in DNA repair